MGAHPTVRSFAAVAVAVAALLLAGCGSDDSGDSAATTDTVVTTSQAATTAATTTTTTTTAPARTVTILVENAAPVGGIKRATVAKGDHVVLVVRSDVADEVHFHGYNLAADVPAGGVGRISFVANVPGRFEIELEHRGVQIGDLTVTP